MQADRESLTFLFTDIEGSSSLWEAQSGPMREALSRHDRVLRRCIESRRGRVIKTTGDGFHAAFTDPLDALLAAGDIQRAAGSELAAGLPLSIRCGLHCGFDESRDGDFFGPDVNRAARIMQAAQGGQILLSQALARRVEGRASAPAGAKPLGRIRLRGLQQPEWVYQWTEPGLRSRFPALRHQTETPHNLPAARTRFFGRAQELAMLLAQVPRERLVLLHGLGGMGKTRLALEAGRALLEVFEDGVWFVELAEVSDPSMVALAVASVLGVKEAAGRGLPQTMAEVLAGQHVLLVMDNCEQVVGAAAQLVGELLAAVPGLHVLATSREPLRLTAEVCVEIAGFGVPREGALSARELAALDVVSLFEDRLRAAQPTFRLDDARAQHVARICRQLDGIPLALELAAAATRRMPLATLAERLEDRLRTLVHGERTAPARQRTLRALIDWSHELLSPGERRVFMRLAVFAGGWTEPAAMAVCEPVGSEAELSAWLGDLVDKSLVQMDPQSGRFRMLDTVRQYAAQRLADSAVDHDDAHARHLRYGLALAEQARPHLGGPEQVRWLQQLDLERDNLLAAHAACAATADGAAASVRLSWALKPYWFNRGLLGQGLRMSREALGRIEAHNDPASHATALFDLGQLCFFAGHHDLARHHLGRCLGLCRETGNRLLEAAALQPLGMACLAADDIDEASTCLVRARQLACDDGHRSFVAYIDNALGQLHRVKGQFERARACNLAAREAAGKQGDVDLEAITWLNEAMIAVEASCGGGAEQARGPLAAALRLCRQSHSQALVQSALEVATAMACEFGAWADALHFWCQAEALARHSGLSRDPADERFLEPRVAAMREAVGALALQQTLQLGGQPDAEDALRGLQQWVERPAGVADAAGGPAAGVSSLPG